MSKPNGQFERRTGIGAAMEIELQAKSSLQERSNLDELPSEAIVSSSSISISTLQSAVIIGSVCSTMLITNMLAGILIVALPTMAIDINLAPNLLLWPPSVSNLASGCTLLIAGSISDVVGPRKMYLSGAMFLTLTTIACGLCRTGIELIMFRAAQGVALSFCLPSSVSIITGNLPQSKIRNVAFACLGAAQPLGFSLGLVLGGVFVSSVGWRYGYYIGAILTFAIFIISIFGIPMDKVPTQPVKMIISRIGTEIDWIGCLLLSAALGMLSYVFSILASGVSHFLAPAPTTLLAIAIVLLGLFAFHARRQERLARKVIIPPSLWTNRVFTSLCVAVFIVWGVFGSIEFFLTLFFQSVQGISAMQTSIRFLPMVVTGCLANLATGWLVHRTRADLLVFVSAMLTATAPLLMAIVKPNWSYWTCAFLATAATPICADVLFTVANLLITSVFPQETHGLAGGVFNTVSSLGISVGLAVTAVVASSVTAAKERGSVETPETLMDGYRATFWLCFGLDILVLPVAFIGLKKIGKVGRKMD